ncbi:5-(aminomethyl)-3-furanmethanol phosphate kinase [hydrothermal vent metagenome]|uniref:5-(Aminomethyl)-3-furanmethanol phosphate kinase n=1 Tax=hydrothermal vent metagenome TaxID=652676 RepID=A0A3B1D5X2_9ZZZZ
MPFSSIVIYKIGGSLLTLPDLAKRLLAQLSLSPHSHPLLIVGGGKVTDVVRAWDELYQLGDEVAHQLALQSLALNEALLLKIIPQAVHVMSLKEAKEVWQAGGIPLLKTRHFLEETEPTSTVPLPHNWDVTSDSIAAWVAIEWAAEKLVLVKSIHPPERFQEQANVVDAYFTKLMPLVPNVEWVNLRD